MICFHLRSMWKWFVRYTNDVKTIAFWNRCYIIKLYKGDNYMGQKDMTEKLLEDYNDVFADILNVLLFEGKQIIRPETLQETKAKSQYKADDAELHEMERDVVKLWQEGNVSFALCGIENQTQAEKGMPLRILNYDGASYRSQLLKGKSGSYYPVLTIILYFGKAHWNQPKTLKKVMHIPPI